MTNVKDLHNFTMTLAELVLILKLFQNLKELSQAEGQLVSEGTG